MKRFIAWLLSVFRKPQTSSKPEPIEQTPVGAPAPTGEKDTVNNGSPKDPDWQYIYDNAVIDSSRLNECIAIARRILGNKARFKEAADKWPGITWTWVGITAYREDTNLSEKACLHNGEYIIGTGKKTKLDPKGRGPFKTWQDAAYDAISIEWSKMSKVMNSSMGPNAKALALFELFNGLGYRSRIGDSGGVEYSPYVAAGTNFHDETSKYVADGKYDKNAKEKQIGALAIMKAIEILEADQLNEGG